MFSHPGMALFKKIGRCGLGGHVSLGVGFEVSKVQAGLSDFLFLLPLSAEVELSATMSACLCCHALLYEDNGLNL